MQYCIVSCAELYCIVCSIVLYNMQYCIVNCAVLYCILCFVIFQPMLHRPLFQTRPRNSEATWNLSTHLISSPKLSLHCAVCAVCTVHCSFCALCTVYCAVCALSTVHFAVCALCTVQFSGCSKVEGSALLCRDLHLIFSKSSISIVFSKVEYSRVQYSTHGALPVV